jgi:hypothetical protein
MTADTSAESAADTDGGLDADWRNLVTAALLGTDRRPPPETSIPIADVVADAVRPDDASRMLAAVAAVAAARRASFVPGPAAPPLQPPAIDDRPWCSPAAVGCWRDIVREWPVLEDEWVLTVIERGLRVPPDALVALLYRHRSDAVRRARVVLAGGSAAGWLADHVDRLAPATSATASAESVGSLPELPVPPDLAELLRVDAHTFAAQLTRGFTSSTFGAAHKAVLVNLLARCRPAVLLDAADALDRTGVGLALALGDLARLRHRMLTGLGVTV